MADFKGTSGEWNVVDRTSKDSSGYLGDFSISNASGEKAAQVYPYKEYGITIDRARANAKLIAAAPKLLERLHKTTAHLISALGRECIDDVVMERCLKATVEQNEKAIKKALGE